MVFILLFHFRLFLSIVFILQALWFPPCRRRVDLILDVFSSSLHQLLPFFLSLFFPSLLLLSLSLSLSLSSSFSLIYSILSSPEYRIPSRTIPPLQPQLPPRYIPFLSWIPYFNHYTGSTFQPTSASGIFSIPLLSGCYFGPAIHFVWTRGIFFFALCSYQGFVSCGQLAGRAHLAFSPGLPCLWRNSSDLLNITPTIYWLLIPTIYLLLRRSIPSNSSSFFVGYELGFNNAFINIAASWGASGRFAARDP